MIFPNKLKASDLLHPADKRSAFNGDRVRPKSEQGSISAREAKGLKVVEGTRKPSGVRQPKTSNFACGLSSAAPCMTYSRPPTAAQRKQEEQRAHEANKKPLSPRQKRMKKGL